MKAVVVDSIPVGEGGVTPGARTVGTRVSLDGAGARIAHARDLAAAFLTRARAEHGLAVSQRAVDVTQLVVSELVTNAHKYAPGPVLMDLRIVGALVEVAVWDSGPGLPVARPGDVGRVGQHGLEIVMAVPRTWSGTGTVGKRVTARIALHDGSDDAAAGAWSV